MLSFAVDSLAFALGTSSSLFNIILLVFRTRFTISLHPNFSDIGNCSRTDDAGSLANEKSIWEKQWFSFYLCTVFG